MTESKQPTVQKQGEVAVLTPPAYFEKEAAEETHRLVADLFRQGWRRFVIDFSRCRVTNSPGVSLLMDLAFKVLDDYHGHLAFCGVDGSKETMFTLLGIIPMVPVKPGLEEAIREVSAAG